MPRINTYHRPETIGEALALLSRPQVKTAILAGGISLVPSLKGQIDEVVDLQALGLDQISTTGDRLEIGAMVRLQRLITHPDIPPVIARTTRYEGPNTFRNAGTLGGVVANANWESELFAALLVHEAKATLQDRAGEKTLPLASLAGSDLEASLLTSIELNRDGTTAHVRVARTPLDAPIVAAVGRKKAGGQLLLAFCGVANKPVLLGPEEIDQLKPPADFRGSSAYRREMAAVLCRRVLDQLA